MNAKPTTGLTPRKTMRRDGIVIEKQTNNGGAPKGNHNAAVAAPRSAGLAVRVLASDRAAWEKAAQLSAKRSVRDAFLSVRCHKTDKAAWIQAANRAVRKDPALKDGRSVLAAWTIRELNAAADAELGPREAAKRQRAAEAAQKP